MSSPTRSVPVSSVSLPGVCFYSQLPVASAPHSQLPVLIILLYISPWLLTNHMLLDIIKNDQERDCVFIQQSIRGHYSVLSFKVPKGFVNFNTYLIYCDVITSKFNFTKIIGIYIGSIRFNII